MPLGSYSISDLYTVVDVPLDLHNKFYNIIQSFTSTILLKIADFISLDLTQKLLRIS